MKIFTLKACLLTLSLFVLGLGVHAQTKKKGDTITTEPKLVVTKLKIGEGETFEVRGKASYTLTAANSDDSLAGVVTYTLPDDARNKIAQMKNIAVAKVPTTVTQKDVVSTYQKLTECPVLHLDFPAMDLVIEGVTLHFNRFVLDVKEGPNPITLYMCTTARQIKNGLPRRGPIRRINEIINGEETQQ
ncbi:MAG: hypothetical protein U0Y68_00660 [Blastocatellia bacterium]